MTPGAKRWAVVSAVLAVAAACAVAWLLTRPVRVVHAPRTYDELGQPSGAEVAPGGAARPTLQGATSSSARRPIRGHVLDDKTGAPLAGVRVLALTSSQAPWRHEATTDAEGSYELDLPEGSYILTTWHPRYIPAELTLALAPRARLGRSPKRVVQVHEHGAPDERHDVRLLPGTRLRARVTDAAGNVLAGSAVRLRSRTASRLHDALPTSLRGRGQDTKPLAPGSDAELLCDERGVVDVQVLPAALEGWSISAHAPGHVGTWHALATEGPWDIALEVVRGAGVRGQVIDGEGRPVSGVWVGPGTVSASRGGAWDPSVPPVRTDDDGRFTIEGLSPTDVTLLAVFEDPHALAGQLLVPRLASGEIRSSLMFEVPTRYVFRARLASLSGELLAGRRVRIVEAGAGPGPVGRAPFATTDDNGHIGVVLPFEGPWRLDISTALGWATLADDVLLPADELALVVAPEPVTRFRLEVVDNDGAPVRDYAAHAWTLAETAEEAQSEHAVKLFADGADVELDVPGTIPVAISLERLDPDTQARHTMRHVLAQLPDDGVVRLVWDPRAQVTGRVVDEADRAIEGVTVHMSWAGAARGGLTSATTAQGTFAFDFDPGTARYVAIQVTPPEGYAQHDVILHSLFDDALVIRLRRGGIVTGRIHVPAGVQFADGEKALVMWPRDDAEVPQLAGASGAIFPDGRFVVEGVPLDRELTWSYRGLTLQKHELIVSPAPAPLRAGDQLEIHTIPAQRIKGRIEGSGDATGLVVRAHPVGEAERAWSWSPDDADDLDFDIGLLPPGDYVVALVNAHGTQATLDQRTVAAGTHDVRLDATSACWIHVRCEPRGLRTSCLLVDAETGRAAGRAYARDEVLRARTLRGRRYDITAVTESTTPGDVPLVGHLADVEAGSEVVLALRSASRLTGRFHGDGVGLFHEIVARRGTTSFPVRFLGRAAFEAWVLPGPYEIVGRSEEGTETVLARGIEPGQEGVVLRAGR
ncbi:MAG: carboxypeptidase regulatory-like domain-containing protein [Planctomycetota bacterium]